MAGKFFSSEPQALKGLPAGPDEAKAERKSRQMTFFVGSTKWMESLPGDIYGLKRNGEFSFRLVAGFAETGKEYKVVPDPTRPDMSMNELAGLIRAGKISGGVVFVIGDDVKGETGWLREASANLAAAVREASAQGRELWVDVILVPQGAEAGRAAEVQGICSDLCRQTGGAFVPVQDENGIADGLGRLTAHLGGLGRMEKGVRPAPVGKHGKIGAEFEMSAEHAQKIMDELLASSANSFIINSWMNEYAGEGGLGPLEQYSDGQLDAIRLAFGLATSLNPSGRKPRANLMGIRAVAADRVQRPDEIMSKPAQERHFDCDESLLFLAALYRQVGIPADNASFYQLYALDGGGHAFMTLEVEGRTFLVDLALGKPPVRDIGVNVSEADLVRAVGAYIGSLGGQWETDARGNVKVERAASLEEYIEYVKKREEKRDLRR